MTPLSFPSGARRGFTLVEMMVGLVVSAVVVGGSIALAISQQKAYLNTSNDRAAQEAARQALVAIGDSLRRAGYGMHPSVALDFGTVPNAVIEYVSTSFAAVGSTSCDPGSGPVACRDRTDGSDEIAFYARDPYFVRALNAQPAASQLTVTGGLTTPLLPGQVLAVACGGACGKRWAYVTVGQTVPANPAAASTAIPLVPAAGGGFDFPRQNAALADTCFGAAVWTDGSPITYALASKVFKVDFYRFYVARFPDPDSGDLRPYLMLDQGLSDGNGPILLPVAPDVDDLQFAYVFPNSPNPANRLVGATPGTRLSNGATAIDLNTTPPTFNDARANAARATQSPANIRAVKVSVVVRSPETDLTLPARAPLTASLPAAGNRPETPFAPGNPGAFPDAYHSRALFEATYDLLNLESRALFCGDYFDGSNPGVNVGGG
jgi:type IV pilus assembly protein PilW